MDEKNSEPIAERLDEADLVTAPDLVTCEVANGLWKYVGHGHSSPARSAMASSGRQLSAARSPQPSGHLGIGAAKLAEAIGRRAAAQAVEAVGPVEPQPLVVLARGAAAHRHNQAAIGERVDQAADERRRLGRPGGEPARLLLVADRAQDVGGFPSVAAVEDAAGLLLVAEEAVRLVDEQGAAGVIGNSLILDGARLLSPALLSLAC